MDPVAPASGADGATIAAVATPAGAGERAVIRVSGPHALAAVRGLVRDPAALPPELERGAHDAELADGLEVTVLWMPGPRSFTGEDVAELHVPGHPALTRAVLGACLGDGRVRMAEPGEFSRRAFENGRLDLTRAEGVAALIAASSAAERRAALALLTGGLERRVARIRDGLEGARTLAEASLDFDEADTGHVPEAEIEARMAAAFAELDGALAWERQREATLTERPRVVLAGLPNAGKSTLFNRLASGARLEAAGPALVSSVEGSTRDTKEATWRLPTPDGGTLDAELIDTAGQVEEGVASGPDREAQRRTREALAGAALVLWVADGTASPPGRPPVGAPALLIQTKADLAPTPWSSLPGWPEDLVHLHVSADSGQGLADLGAAAGRLLSAGGGAAGQAGLVSARHLAGLRGAREALLRAREALAAGAPLDLVAEEMRAATDALDAISGRTVPEGLLSRIFASFCLGK